MSEKNPIVSNGVSLMLDETLVDFEGEPILMDTQEPLPLRKFLLMACGRSEKEGDALSVFLLGSKIAAHPKDGTVFVLDAANLETLKRIIRHDPAQALIKGQILKLLEGK